MGVRGVGATPAQAFEQAALALTALITDPRCVVPNVAAAIECEAPDLELLFADWLNAVVYEMATRRMLFARFAVTIEKYSLHGLAWGEPVDPARHHPAVEVKAATYTALRVFQRDGEWIAQTVVDV